MRDDSACSWRVGAKFLGAVLSMLVDGKSPRVGFANLMGEKSLLG
jgi:hypothetical protein